MVGTAEIRFQEIRPSPWNEGLDGYGKDTHESMTDIASSTPEHKQHQCRKCGQRIFWHKAQSGKFYPGNDANNRKDFHKCVGPAAQKPDPTPKPQPLTPSYFEPSIEQRVEHIEKQLAALVRTVQEVHRRQPITAEDVGF